MFKDVAWSIIEERLQTWQVSALLQDALQSLFTLKMSKKKKVVTSEPTWKL